MNSKNYNYIVKKREELLNKNQAFQCQSNFIPSLSHNLCKYITPVHSWQGFLTIAFASCECINVRIIYTGVYQLFHYMVCMSNQKR